MPHDNVEFLNRVHEMNDKVEAAIEFVTVFVTAPAIPPEVQVEFEKIASTLRIQQHLVKHLLEENMELFDKLEALVRKHSLEK